MDGAFAGVIWRVRASKADLLEQEPSRMSPDFASVDTLFWMDRGTCCGHSARSPVGGTPRPLSPLGLALKTTPNMVIAAVKPPCINKRVSKSGYTWKYKYRLLFCTCAYLFGASYNRAFALPRNI